MVLWTARVAKEFLVIRSSPVIDGTVQGVLSCCASELADLGSPVDSIVWDVRRPALVGVLGIFVHVRPTRRAFTKRSGDDFANTQVEQV